MKGNEEEVKKTPIFPIRVKIQMSCTLVKKLKLCPMPWA